MVHASLPVRTFAEFLAYAKKNPGKLDYGSGGAGGMGQLNVEMLKANTGIYATHIPYRGGSQLITAVLSNEVQFIWTTWSSCCRISRTARCARWRWRPSSACRSCPTCRPSPNWAIRSST